MHDRDHRLSLLGRVAAVLRQARIPHALIGASALAAHGVARSSTDQDLFALDPRGLDAALWADLRGTGVRVEIRHGDLDDPLAGVVRFEADGEHPVDLVIGKSGWQLPILEGAERRGGEIPVVTAAHLILLKLYAGGPQDAWDIQQLLATEERSRLVAEVERDLARLPPEPRVLWTRILTGP
jgi:hypothetical protein